ncbi:hypothetical protein CONPUDRAFT_140363 [Coniophora puteana RWD-64-598 SS2]|uniref:Protein kinase domain-containing protein n=1 Tax=Coniophora puteana (strain RWD-64-598) TaxID=741705 RepID=A0A5M3M7Z5_CONPW|nr:uncharacterized protein CONPUDRAFT_140363 [Coniophora puteana RWD-64-598 SS2]EIW75046.1 hypothetical protein CONPUDRAFT_140363 [Coniophora puteana RWD-64-598 SS2]
MSASLTPVHSRTPSHDPTRSRSRAQSPIRARRDSPLPSPPRNPYHVPGDATPPNAPPRSWWNKRKPQDDWATSDPNAANPHMVEDGEDEEDEEGGDDGGAGDSAVGGPNWSAAYAAGASSCAQREAEVHDILGDSPPMTRSPRTKHRALSIEKVDAISAPAAVRSISEPQPPPSTSSTSVKFPGGTPPMVAKDLPALPRGKSAPQTGILSALGVGLEEKEHEERKVNSFFGKGNALSSVKASASPSKAPSSLGSVTSVRRKARNSTGSGSISSAVSKLYNPFSRRQTDKNGPGSHTSPARPSLANDPPAQTQGDEKGKKPEPPERQESSTSSASRPRAGSWAGMGQHHVKKEDKEARKRTKQHVSVAINSILNPEEIEQQAPRVGKRLRIKNTVVHAGHVAAPIAKEALNVAIDVTRFVPVLGLEEAARTLLSIWEAMEQVDTNRLACLRLIERCATILYSVRIEVDEAGSAVGDELEGPLGRLVAALHEIHAFLLRQVNRPFIKRYLKRDEILREITACDRALTDVVGMFGVSIQIRVLRQVQEVTAEQRRNWAVLSQTAMVGGNRLGLTGVDQPPATGSGASPPPIYSSLGPPSGHASPGGSSAHLTPTPSHPNLEESVSTLRPPTLPYVQSSTSTDTAVTAIPPRPDYIRQLTELHHHQNAEDHVRDEEALRVLLRAAIGSHSDEEMMRMMQIGKGEIPEAVRTLRRALELQEPEAGGGSPSSEPGWIDESEPVPEIGGAAKKYARHGVSNRRDTLDREFLESGIDAMTRLSARPGFIKDASNIGVSEDDAPAPWDLPSWTITRWEVDRISKIGVGFFSDVYLGRWREHHVAIKVLGPTVPRSLFVREVSIWRELRHPNVLRLYGASSAAGEKPWFIVSHYCNGGSLVKWLKLAKDRELDATRSGTGSELLRQASPRQREKRRVASVGDSLVSPEVDVIRCMHQVAKGMEYLHSKGVFHGDLKAANVLVDESGRCVISDFGQSELKSEAYRLSGTALPHGTLRWQAPELVDGDNRLKPEIDVYAFAISCIEILGMGDLPWSLLDDTTVAHLIFDNDRRPPFPHHKQSTEALRMLITRCWARDPALRPPFSDIATELKRLRRPVDEGSPHPPKDADAWAEPGLHRIVFPSPDPRPTTGLPVVESAITPPQQTVPLDDSDVYETASSHMASDGRDSRSSRDMTMSPVSDSSASQGPPEPFKPIGAPHRHHTGHSHEGQVDFPVPVIYTPSRQSSMPGDDSESGSGTSSLFSSSPPASLKNLPSPTVAGSAADEYAGYTSPPLLDDRQKLLRDERRYRLLARHTHEFNHTLTLPLWSPSHIALGSVGYLSKPSGEFVVLFNALDPVKTSDGVLSGMPRLQGYGDVKEGKQRQDKRNAAQRTFLDAIPRSLAGLLTFKDKGDGSYSESVSRRYSFPLRAGTKAAYVFAESTMYRFIENLDAPKSWFKANVDTIMKQYASSHLIQKEDVFLVVGTLDAPDYALFVSHAHPDGHAHFNVYANPRVGQSWGTFTTDAETSAAEEGPSYQEEIPERALFASKVSDTTSGTPPTSRWDTLLLGRLRFKPDVDEPTSL